jgi:acylphosphatase
MLVARRFVVSGRVQRVGFRYFTAEAAKAEGLGGWVRNLPDGRVEAVAEGEAAAVDRFAARLRGGPPGSRVERVDVEDREPLGQPGSFRIEPGR